MTEQLSLISVQMHQIEISNSWFYMQVPNQLKMACLVEKHKLYCFATSLKNYGILCKFSYCAISQYCLSQTGWVSNRFLSRLGILIDLRGKHNNQIANEVYDQWSQLVDDFDTPSKITWFVKECQNNTDYTLKPEAIFVPDLNIYELYGFLLVFLGI